MMDEDVVPVGQPREKTAPFLIRAFIKIGNFHRLTLFDDGTLPTTDEQQLFTWKDATLREIVTTIRNTAPTVPEYRHPLARFSFRTVYADPGNKGRFSSKELGSISSREILGDSGTLTTVAPRLLEDEDTEPSTREREERTLDELRFVPGDYLIVAVHLPKSVTAPSELAIKADGEGRLQPLVLPDAEEVIGGGIRIPLHPEVGEVEAEVGTEVGTSIDAYPRLEEVNLLREAGGVAVRDPVRGRPGGGDMIRQLDSLNFVVPAPMFVAFRSQNVYVVCVVLPVTLP
ncbi:hypothetical protein EYR36_006742 [Pleurotus pulmonarius]|nr:hypothetical protein EYR36_006742 [Pleurotus pulmonarius]